LEVNASSESLYLLFGLLIFFTIIFIIFMIFNHTFYKENDSVNRRLDRFYIIYICVYSI
jgi:hypothetical protein